LNIEIIVSEKDPVGRTAKKLFDFKEVKDDVTDFTYNDADAMVILSRHESSSHIPAFTVHYPGNPSEKAMGGRPKTLGIAFPRLLTSIYREMLKINVNIDKVIEATHHGPTLNKPVVFAEIGSSEEYWENEKLVKELVNSVVNGIDKYQSISCEKIAVGFGGPHYATYFSELAKKYCISHIISKHYLTELDSNIINQVIQNSIDRIDTIIFDSVNRNLRQKIMSSINSNNISIEFR